MKIVSAVLTGYTQLSRIKPEISREAQNRRKWFDYYEKHNRNARLTCRYFGISHQTFYRWLKRYDPKHPETLESRSHRPRKVRRPTYSIEQIEAVRKMREKYPRWGKDKLVVLLERENCKLPVSMN